MYLYVTHCENTIHSGTVLHGWLNPPRVYKQTVSIVENSEKDFANLILKEGGQMLELQGKFGTAKSIYRRGR